MCDHDLPPETDKSGSEEYKLVAFAESAQRTIKLQTQMEWRLREGHGAATYRLGYENDGRAIGVIYPILSDTITHFMVIAGGINARVERLTITNVGGDLTRVNLKKPFYRKITAFVDGRATAAPDRYVATMNLKRKSSAGRSSDPTPVFPAE